MAYTFDEIRAQLTLEAKAYADQFDIPISLDPNGEPRPFGYNDARDAFRHAYSSAVIGFEYSLYASKLAGD